MVEGKDYERRRADVFAGIRSRAHALQLRDAHGSKLPCGQRVTAKIVRLGCSGSVHPAGWSSSSAGIDTGTGMGGTCWATES